MEPERAELGRDFVAITAAVMALPVTRIVLDGEAVAHCPEGLPDFHALLGREGCARACLYAFDLLRFGARRPSRPCPRRAPGLAPGAPEARRRRDHLQRAHGGRGRRGDVPSRLRPGPRRHRVERATSRYRSGRCAAWVKSRTRLTSGAAESFRWGGRGAADRKQHGPPQPSRESGQQRPHDAVESSLPSRIGDGRSRLHQSFVGFSSGDDQGGVHGAIGVRPMHCHRFAEPSAVQAVLRPSPAASREGRHPFYKRSTIMRVASR